MEFAHPDRAQVEAQPASLLMKAVKIYPHDVYAREIVGSLAGTKECRIIGFMKPQAVIALQRRVLLANAVQPGNDILQAVRGFQVALFQFIFLGVQVFFPSGRQWSVLAELKGGTINSVRRTKCCGQNKADHERSAAADL